MVAREKPKNGPNGLNDVVSYLNGGAWAEEFDRFILSGMPDSCWEADFQVLTPSEDDVTQNSDMLWA